MFFLTNMVSCRSCLRHLHQWHIYTVVRTSTTVEFSEREQLEWSDRFEDWSDGTEPDVEGTEHREAPLSSSTPFICCTYVIYPHST